LTLFCYVLELPHSAVSNVFDNGMNNGQGLNQFNQVQFDSFVNESSNQQQGSFGGSMSLPPNPHTGPPSTAIPVNRSGPPSLEGNAMTVSFLCIHVAFRVYGYNNLS